MPDETPEAPGEGPPSYPGAASPPPPPVPAPQMPPPAPPSYPGGAYPPPPPPPTGQFGQYGQPTPGGQSPYASWGARVGGWLIDFVIILVVNGILSRLFRHTSTGAVHFTMTTTTNGNTVVHHNEISFLALAIATVLSLAYSTILCGNSRGQTVGMMAVGARAVKADGHTVLGYGPAFGRALLEWVFGYTVILWVLDMLFPLWDARNQTLHDKAASAVVIRVRNAG
jgi:uncharacterized RDD family membrane protein YckC